MRKNERMQFIIIGKSSWWERDAAHVHSAKRNREEDAGSQL